MNCFYIKSNRIKKTVSKVTFETVLINHIRSISLRLPRKPNSGKVEISVSEHEFNSVSAY